MAAIHKKLLKEHNYYRAQNSAGSLKLDDKVGKNKVFDHKRLNYTQLSKNMQRWVEKLPDGTQKGHQILGPVSEKLRCQTIAEKLASGSGEMSLNDFNPSKQWINSKKRSQGKC